jgi:CubicO group peptidase (beta-lactamase class C family)
MRGAPFAAWLSALALAAGSAMLPAMAQAPSQAPLPATPRTEAPASVSGEVPVAPEARPAVPALTAADVETWLDGLMPGALRIAGVPGAVVVLVKDGKPLLQKGYGYADWDKAQPVDPARTLFRPGSISKLFTWTAVMQQVEQGKLDLDADVNRYLDFQVPGRNGKALTLRHILTHTTGLEETGRALIVYGEHGSDNAQVLKNYIPPYLYDPGSTQGYSNWATGLAGYIVQRTSGLSFDDYIEQRIFAPLKMTQSSFRQPLPKALRGQMSQGYLSADEAPKGFEVVSLPPAGSLSSPGSDMARFMLAYLNGGELDGQRILKPETVKLMHSQITRGMPELNGIGLGFYQQDVNGRRAVGHGGDTILFHSDLILLVDEGIGIYVSVNSPGRNDLGKWLRERLYHGFADRYLPDTRPASAPGVDQATAEAHAKMLAGAYRNSRREDSTFFSILQLLSPLKVEAVEGGRVAMTLGGSRSVFREVKPFLWEEVNGKRRLQAIVENGAVRRWGLEPYVFAFVFEPVPFMASGTMLMLLTASLLLVLGTVLAWPVVARLRRRHGLPPPARSLTWLRLACLLALASVGLWAMVFTRMDNSDPSTLLLLAQLLSWLAFLGGLGVALWHARTAFAAGARKAALVLPMLWVLGFLVLTAVGFYHHLLSFNPNY